MSKKKFLKYLCAVLVVLSIHCFVAGCSSLDPPPPTQIGECEADPSTTNPTSDSPEPTATPSTEDPDISTTEQTDPPVTEETTVPTEHTHSCSITSSKEPTCTEAGRATYRCSTCNYTYTLTMGAPLGHSWSGWHASEKEGALERNCSVCGAKQVEQAADPVEHTHDYSIISSKEPTCTEAGYDTYRCPTCNHTYTDVTSAPLGHSWSDWEVITKATTVSEGEKKHTCTVCGCSESAAIPKITIDPGSIESVGNGYAASVGFTVDYSLSLGNAGYRNPDFRPFSSMDEAYSVAISMVAATKSQLLASWYGQGYIDNPDELPAGVRCRVLVVYSHTDVSGSWYYTYVLYG